jgi:PHD/YefM family antitoxin component YafN of YafNO toxin-antitoxin module
LTFVRRCGSVSVMAEIELGPLSHRLDDDEVKLLAKRLKDVGVTDFDRGDDGHGHTIAARLSEDALTEFLDRLDAHDVGAEIYLPIEFEGRVTVGEYRVASTHALLDVLEEMKEELGVDEEEEYEDDEEEDEEEEEEEDEGTVIEAQLRHIWQLVSDGATESIDKSIPLHLQT